MSYVLRIGFVALLATLAAAPALGQPDPLQSEARLVVCPQGDATSVVFVRDGLGQPMPGIAVILDPGFSQGPWSFCEPPQDFPFALTEADGGARFQLTMGGFADNFVVLVDDGGGPQPFLNNVFAPGFDLDGSRLVDNLDFDIVQSLLGTNAPEADYDHDGQVQVQDEILFFDHVSHACDQIQGIGLQAEGLRGQINVRVIDTTAEIGFTGTPLELAESTVDMTIGFGPEDGAGAIELLLEHLGGSIDAVPSPLGYSGDWDIGLTDGAGPILGMWETDDTFTLGPFDAVFSCSAIDSVRDPIVAVENFPVSMDYFEREGDTVQCVIEGMLVQEDGGFSMMATMRALPGQQGQWQQLDRFEAPILIGNYGGGDKAKVRLVGTKVICWELCMLPIIICDDEGRNCGLSIQGRYRGTGGILEETKRIMAQACVRVRDVSPLVLNSTAIREYESSNPAKRTHSAFKRIVERTPEYRAWFGPALKAMNLRVRDCVTAIFLDGPAIAHTSGAYADATRGDKVLINHKLVDDKCANEEGVPANNRVLAHELIHTLGIIAHTTGDPKTCMHDCAEGGDMQGGKNKGSTELIQGTTSHAGHIANKSGSKGKLRRTTDPCYQRQKIGGRTVGCQKVK